MYIYPTFSTLILAGGQATRMNGNDKGLVIWQDAPLISHVLKNLPKDDVVISCNRNLAIYSQYGRVVSDKSPILQALWQALRRHYLSATMTGY
jgi:molybdopterin-guanine dinucleotide biosynthesis protein A